MIDKKLVYNKIEDLLREVARIEFSMDYHPTTVVAAFHARTAVEKLLEAIGEDSK